MTRVQRRLRDAEILLRPAIPHLQEGSRVEVAVALAETDQAVHVGDPVLGVVGQQQVVEVAGALEQLLDQLVRGQAPGQRAQLRQRIERSTQRLAFQRFEPFERLGSRRPRLPERLSRGLQQRRARVAQADRGDHLVAQRDEGRAQEPERQQVVARTIEQAQHVEQVAHLHAVGEARRGRQPVGDLRVSERALDRLESGAPAVQHGDVAEVTGAEFTPVRVAYGRARLHQPPDPPRDQPPLRVPLLLGVLAFRGYEPVDRRGRRALHTHLQMHVGHDAVAALLLQPGRRLGDRVAGGRVGELDDRRRAAEVTGQLPQLPVRADPSHGRIPHRHVRTAEAVDALFGIADEKQLRRTLALPDRQGDLPLRTVGVLELVDDQNAQPAADARARRRTPLRTEPRVHVQHERVEVPRILALQVFAPALERLARQLQERIGEPCRLRARLPVVGTPARARRRRQPLLSAVRVPAQLAQRTAHLLDQPLGATSAAHRRRLEQQLHALVAGIEPLEQQVVDALPLRRQRLVLVEHAEAGVDAETQRLLAQQPAAEGVDRADRCLLQLPQQALAGVRILQRFAQLALEIDGRFLREGDRRDLAQRARPRAGGQRPAGRVLAGGQPEQPEDLAHDRRRLTGAGVGHQQRVPIAGDRPRLLAGPAHLRAPHRRRRSDACPWAAPRGCARSPPAAPNPPNHRQRLP